MEIKDFIIRLLIAMAAGALIGLERQLHRKSAGLRTNSLVAMGSAMFVMLSYKVTGESGGDVTRIIAQIVTGIGFLGAGVILHQGLNIQGLTTAATIWCSSAIGCLSAVAILFVNIVFHWIDDNIRRPDNDDKFLA
jgi:putative Mg2+ transporter-C (MgtC) family protein